MQRPSPKRIAKILVLIAAPFVAIAVSVVVGIVVKVPELFVDPVFVDARRQLHDVALAVDDDATFAEHAGFNATHVDGRDASAFLLPLVRWTRGKHVVSAGSLGAASVDSDFGWMKRLADFNTWDVDANDFARPDDNVFVRALPDGDALLEWGKARLTRGERDNDVDGARADVVQLCRLMIETEQLGLASRGLKLWKRAEPARADTIDRWSRLMLAQGLYLHLGLLDDEIFGRGAALKPFHCVGLNESQSWNLGFRRVLDDDAERWWPLLTKVVDRSAGTCRLSWVRRAWHSDNHLGEIPDGPRSFCALVDDERTGLCWLPDLTYAIPGVRGAGGGVLAAVSLPNFLAGYQKPKPAQ